MGRLSSKAVEKRLRPRIDPVQVFEQEQRLHLTRAAAATASNVC